MRSMGRSRPLGITIIAIILGVSAILSIIAIILGLVAVNSHASGVVGGALDTGLIIAGIFAVLELILAWGLWTLQTWAFWATAIIEAIRVISAVISLIVGHASLGSTLLSIIIPLIVLIYLFADRNVRAAFRT